MLLLKVVEGAAVAEWLSSWLAEQEDQGSIPGLATWIFRDWLSPAFKLRYGWKIAKSTLILKTTNQPTKVVEAGIDFQTSVYVNVHSVQFKKVNMYISLTWFKLLPFCHNIKGSPVYEVLSPPAVLSISVQKVKG